MRCIPRHYNHVTFTPIAKNVMLYCRLIYMLSILCVRLTINVKVGIPESFKVGWYPPPRKTGSSHLKPSYPYICTGLTIYFSIQKTKLNTPVISLGYLFLNLRTYSKFNPIPLFIKNHISNSYL